MKSKDLTAIKLRVILVAAAFLIVGGTIAVFMYGYNKIQLFSSEAQSTAAEATASKDSLQNIQATKNALDKEQDVIDRTSELASKQQGFAYQDKIISVVNQLASRAGISITNISFAAAGAASAAPAAPTTPPANPGGSESTAVSGSSVKTATATVTLKTPIPYNSMLNFIYMIEQSLFRMQISKISLSPASTTGGSDSVNSDALTIEVYVQ
ncbi:MAG: hypothetical protein ABI397_03555 [Candidatus Saccharimonas sp.]